MIVALTILMTGYMWTGWTFGAWTASARFWSTINASIRTYIYFMVFMRTFWTRSSRTCFRTTIDTTAIFFYNMIFWRAFWTRPTSSSCRTTIPTFPHNETSCDYIDTIHSILIIVIFYFLFFAPRKRSPPNICLTCNAYIGALFAAKRKQKVWQ